MLFIIYWYSYVRLGTMAEKWVVTAMKIGRFLLLIYCYSQKEKRKEGREKKIKGRSADG